MLHHFRLTDALRLRQQAAGLVTVLCLSINVFAQISPSQERDIGIRNQQELQRQQQQEQQQRQQLERTTDVRLTAQDKATSQTLPIETPCFLIEHLRLQSGTGAPLPEFDWLLEQLTAPDAPVFIGQCVGAQGVAWLIERTQKVLVDRGFVTSRVLATQQDMSQGTLALTLIPGRIRAIRLAEPVDPRANLRNALPMQAGDILNLRDIEQALENLKRVPTAEADIQIEPAQGDSAQLGDSDLVVSYSQPFPFRLSVNVDDSGTKATGRYQGSVTVSYDNALTRYTPGTPGVRIYNDESDYLATPEGSYENWSAYNYTRTTTETRVDHADPGQILSGRAMNLSGGTLTNDKSRIIAGGTLTATLATLNNTEVMGERTITDVGSVTSYWRNRQKGTDSTGSSSAGYNPAVVIQTLTLTPTQYLQNTAPTGSGTQVGVRIQATVTGNTSGVGTSNARNGAVSPTSLPASSLYKTNPSATSTYLVETDTRFTNNKVWLGSDFMTQSLSLDPTVTQKRLGDGFYEQKLIREQVAQLTGRRFLADYTSDEQEYKALMTSAITFGQKYNLRPGIALTAQQIAQLTSDIVWLVEQTVTLSDGSRQKVLVPQLYVKVQPGDLDGTSSFAYVKRF